MVFVSHIIMSTDDGYFDASNTVTTRRTVLSSNEYCKSVSAATISVFTNVGMPIVLLYSRLSRRPATACS